MSHKPGSRLPLLSTWPAVTLETLKRAATNLHISENSAFRTRQSSCRTPYQNLDSEPSPIPFHAHPNTRGCTQDARTRAIPIYSPMVVYLGRLVRVGSFQFTCCGQASTCVYACGSCIARGVDRSLRGHQAMDGGSRRHSSLSQRVDSKFCQREYYKRI